MPPIVLDPPNNGSTHTTSYYFIPVNGHGTHGPTSIDRWKVTVTTAQVGAGTLKTQTSWITTPITTCPVNNLPADNKYYWSQIVYYKRTSTGQVVGPYTSISNKFQSRP